MKIIKTIKFKKYLSLSLVMVLFSLIFTACGGKSEFSLTNGLSLSLDELYLSAADSKDWGSNTMADGAFTVGRTVKLELDKDTELFDIHAVDSSGDFYIFEDLKITAGSAVELRHDGDYAAVITPKKGDPITVTGSIEGSRPSDPSVPAANDTPASGAAPSPADELTNSIAIPDYESISVPYPGTMKLKDTAVVKRQVQLEAINDDSPNNIIVSWYDVGSSFDSGLNASPESAKSTFISISDTMCKRLTDEDQFIERTGEDFISTENYYGIRCYVQMKGSAVDSSVTDPVKGVLECRYYGPVGALLVAFSMSNEDHIDSYSAIATGILDKMQIPSSWTTAKAGLPMETQKPSSAPAGGSNENNRINDDSDYDEDYDYDYYEDYDDDGDYYDDEDYDDSGDYYDEDYDDSGDYYDEDYDDSGDDYSDDE